MTEAEWLSAETPAGLLRHVARHASHRKLRLFACACCRPLPDRVPTPGVPAAEMLEAADGFADGRVPPSAFREWFPARDPLTGARGLHELPRFHDLDALGQRVCQAVEKLGWPPAEGPNSGPIDPLPPADGGPHARGPGGYAADRTGDAWECAGQAWGLLESGYPYPGTPYAHGPRNTAAGVPEGFYQKEREAHARFAVLFRDVFGDPFRPATLDPEWLTPTVTAIAQGMYESRDFSPMPILADALQDAGCDSEDVLNHCRGPGPHVRGCWVVDLVLGKQ